MAPPTDHFARMARAHLALDGLSVGDAFGERFFVSPEIVDGLIASRTVPQAPWGYTDDTEMALGIVEVLDHFGTVDRDALATVFARRYAARPDRGYGGTAHGILADIGAGEPWREVARRPFDGMGSMGNGGAMRAAPIGAYFADDLDRVVDEARASAEVTHAHPDGQAGAIAVSVAAAHAARMGSGQEARVGRMLLEGAHAATPNGGTCAGLAQALAIPLDSSVKLAASALGTGRRVLSWDTVPFALWCAARHLESYAEALWTTVSGLGDRDTTCAMVGGIVVLAVGRDQIPREWLSAREPLELHPSRG